MVDLRDAILCAQGYVVQMAVGLRIQLPMSEQKHRKFVGLPLGPRRLECSVLQH